MSRAINLIFRGTFDKAENELKRASDLSPNYFEVHRVFAFYYMSKDDFFSAEASFNSAISLAPERAPLRVWFGGFLSRSLGDSERALEQFLKAEELEPNAPLVKLECARVLQYQRRFADALERLDAIQNLENLSAKTRRVHLDLVLQNYIREADFLGTNEKWIEAIGCLKKAREIFKSAPLGLIDARTLKAVQKSRRLLPGLARAFKAMPEEASVIEVRMWLNSLYESTEGENAAEKKVEALPADSTQDLGVPDRGVLSSLQRRYGFVEVGTRRLFFHIGDWVSVSPYDMSLEGRIVEFIVGSSNKGPCAHRVKLLEDDVDLQVLGKAYTGTVRALNTTFGFILMDSGKDIFFHRSSAIDTGGFRSLREGQRVMLKYGKQTDGKIYAFDVAAYSGEAVLT